MFHQMYNAYLDELTHFNQTSSLQNKKTNPDNAPDATSLLFTEVLGIKARIGKAKSTVSREDLGL